MHYFQFTHSLCQSALCFPYAYVAAAKCKLQGILYWCSHWTLRAGLLYLLSCLARFEDMRAELDGAGAVDVLLELLGSCLDTKVQASVPPVEIMAGASAACAHGVVL